MKVSLSECLPSSKQSCAIPCDRQSVLAYYVRVPGPADVKTHNTWSKCCEAVSAVGSEDGGEAGTTVAFASRAKAKSPLLRFGARILSLERRWD